MAIVYADGVDELLYKLNDKILNPVIELSFVIALVVFLFGLMEFIRGGMSADKRQKGQQHMLWGIIGFVVMFCVYGIINLLVGTLGIKGVTVNKDEQSVKTPCIQDLKIDNQSQGSFLPCSE